ncbi:MAG: ATP-binding protein [Anaerolineae bacterium]
MSKASAEIHYQRLFDWNPTPVVVLGPEGHLIEANRSAVRRLDLDKDDLAGFSLSQVGLSESRFSQLKDELRETGSTTWEFELSTDPLRVFDVTLARLPDEVLEGEAYQWVAHDVSRRVKLERTREQFANMVVHDLRAPLGNILNSLDLVLTAWRERDVTIPVQQVLGIALRSARRMEDLISDILNAARLQTKARNLAVREIDVAKIVSEVVETVANSAEQRQQSLQMRVPPDFPSMYGDPDLIRRIFVNLIGNAIKYTQRGGEIVVSAELNDEAFVFAVADNGPGIAPEDQQHMFELFFRGSMQFAKGAGIGLAFTKLAIEAHGGRIWFETTLGEGSTFFFTIPRDLPEAVVVYDEETE